MRVWLIKLGEPLPIDPGGRLLRYGILARLLSEQGHEVVNWSTTFDHYKKIFRRPCDTTIQINERYWLVLQHSIAYRRNVSMRRLINHWEIAQKFRSQARRLPRPDVIVCSIPTVEQALAALDYGQAEKVPVIIDCRDWWPDVFLTVVPRWARPLARFLLTPSFRAVQVACRRATAICGITPPYVEWGLRNGHRPRTDLDRDFPLAYSEQRPPDEAIAKAEKFWDGLGVPARPRELTVCFFGMMGRQTELDTAIAAVRSLPVKLILCGTGENLQRYQEAARGCPNILFPGYVGAAEIWTLMRRSSLGLAPYYNTLEFMTSYPTKVIEYLSAGLPVVTSLRGITGELLVGRECGLMYDCVEQLTKQLKRVNRLEVMSKNATRLFQERFVAEKVYSEMIDYLSQIAQRR